MHNEPSHRSRAFSISILEAAKLESREWWQQCFKRNPQAENFSGRNVALRILLLVAWSTD